MKIVAVLPVYNEENTIGDIVRIVKKYVDLVVVVDNNSTDRTVWEAQKAEAKVYTEKIQGQGAATRLGWNSIRWGNYYDILVTLDADGQHNPEEIPRLLNTVKSPFRHSPDIVIGSRFLLPAKAPCYRKFGIDVITWLYNVGHKQKIVDSQSCFRAYRRKVLEIINIEENGFGLSTEVLIKARKLGFKIIEVPISCIYHKDRRMNSTLNPVRHGLEVAWKTIWWRLKLWN